MVRGEKQIDIFIRNSSFEIRALKQVILLLTKDYADFVFFTFLRSCKR